MTGFVIATSYQGWVTTARCCRVWPFAIVPRWATTVTSGATL